MAIDREQVKALNMVADKGLEWKQRALAAESRAELLEKELAEVKANLQFLEDSAKGSVFEAVRWFPISRVISGCNPGVLGSYPDIGSCLRAARRTGETS